MLELRPATISDCGFIYGMSNEPSTRNFCRFKEHIKWEEHCKWYTSLLDAHTPMYIVEKNYKKVGFVRFTPFSGLWRDSERDANIGIMIRKKYRGCGLGTHLLTQACARVFKDTGLENIHAYIHKDNLASLALFKKCGFAPLPQKDDAEFLNFCLER